MARPIRKVAERSHSPKHTRGYGEACGKVVWMFYSQSKNSTGNLCWIPSNKTKALQHLADWLDDLADWPGTYRPTAIKRHVTPRRSSAGSRIDSRNPWS